MAKKILFLIPFPLRESPSQRFRFEQYFDHLRARGFTFQVQSFLEAPHSSVFFRPGKGLLKAFLLLKGFARRLLVLRKAAKSEWIFIHREAAPIGPPIIEFLIAKVLGKKIIYDFDDAIWMTDRTDESAVRRLIKWRDKVGYICQASHKVSCGNKYLCAYARKFNQRVVCNPTTIDLQLHTGEKTIRSSTEQVVIGWTGSHTTLKYLVPLVPVLKEVVAKFPGVQIKIIANQPPPFSLPGLHYLPWSLASEIQDLSSFDIGLMPIPDDEWSKGKCGFKALQYMAMGIPPIASPVGVNTRIITHQVNGLLAATPDQWLAALTWLINDPQSREQLGMAAMETVARNYSVSSNSENFLSLFA